MADPFLSQRVIAQIFLLSGGFLQDPVEQSEVALQYLGLHQHWLLGVRTRGDQRNAGVFIFLTNAVKITDPVQTAVEDSGVYLNCFLQVCVWAAIIFDILEKLQDFSFSCQRLSSLPKYLLPNVSPE